MNLRKTVFSLLLCIASLSSMADTQVVSQDRVNLFLDSQSPFTTIDWTVGSTVSGNVKILKSTAGTTFGLVNALRESGLGDKDAKSRFVLDAIANGDMSHARISDTKNSAKGQCVDFAKVMMGNENGTGSWRAGARLGDIPQDRLLSTVAPGTVIVFFDGNSRYPVETGHVAIVLSWSFDAKGKPSGVTVVDQNFLKINVKVDGVNKGQMPETIAKHFLPLTGSGRNSAGNYNILDMN